MSRGMKQHWFHILVALASAPKHGSAIANEVFELSDGRIRLWPTTLYGSLDEMSERGLLQTLDGESHPAGESERKRYYQLTATGRRVLLDESGWYRSMADLASKRLRMAAKAAE